MEEFEDKRKHQRIKADWPALIKFDGKEIECRTENISLEGVYVISDEILPIDELIKISLKPEHHEIINFYGKVIRANIYGINKFGKAYGAGVLFVEKSEIDSKQYDSFYSFLLKKFQYNDYGKRT